MWGWRSRSPSGELARRGLSAGRDCAARRVGRERSRQASSVALGSQAALAESQCDTVAPSRRCQDFALNLSAKRRLCNTVGGRGIEGAARCCALSTARSRAAATTNLARSNQSLVLRLRFGEAKTPTLVNVFMACPRLSPAASPTTNKILPRDGAHLMACVTNKWARAR
jgi:hypothetical protein